MPDATWVTNIIKSPETVPHAVTNAEPAPPIVPPPGAAATPAEPPKVDEPKPAADEKEAKEARLAAAKLREARKAEQGALNKLREAKNIQARLKQQYAEIEALKQAQAEAKINPDAYLRKLYGDDWYDQLTQYRLQGGTPPVAMAMQAVEQKLEAKLQELGKQVTDTRAQFDARQDADDERTEQAFNIQAADYVKTNADKYEFTNLYGQQDQVPALIKLEWQKAVAKYEEALAAGETPEEPKLMSIVDAADRVEKYYEDLVAKSAATKKWQAKQAAVATPAGPGPRTLTNDMTASTPNTVSGMLSEEQRIQNALNVAAKFKK
jgi:hypothetical protein